METVWVAVAFVILIVLLYKPVSKKLAEALDARSAKIEHELSEAVRLREEAQETLAAYQKKHREISEEAEAIIRTAKEEAAAMQKRAQTELKQAVEARIESANEKIQYEEQKAVEDVQKQVVEIAVEAARTVIVENLQGEADESLIELAVKDINRIVH